MNFLVSEGFTYETANRLPLIALWTETKLAEERVNQTHATVATLTRCAIIDCLAVGNHLQEAIDIL